MPQERQQQQQRQRQRQQQEQQQQQEWQQEQHQKQDPSGDAGSKACVLLGHGIQGAGELVDTVAGSVGRGQGGANVTEQGPVSGQEAIRMG